MISWATKMPLFEWQLREITTDFSSVCDGNLPSHWTTRFGESLDVGDKSSLLKNLSIVLRRSRNDETLDRISLGLYNTRLWLFIGVIVSIVYVWWCLLRNKQNRFSHAVMAVLLTTIAVGISVFLSQVVRLAGPAIGGFPYYEIWDCQGTITFSASLSEIHYETLVVLLTSVVGWMGSLGVMVYQIRRTLVK
jgi:hypothetical protein